MRKVKKINVTVQLLTTMHISTSISRLNKLKLNRNSSMASMKLILIQKTSRYGNKKGQGQKIMIQLNWLHLSISMYLCILELDEKSCTLSLN